MPGTSSVLNVPLLSELIEKGSFTDKLLSLKYFIKKNPKQAQKHFNDLLNLCSSKNRRDKYLAIQKTIECIIENAYNYEIPNDFAKEIHVKFVSILKEALDDKIPKIRLQIIGFLTDLARCSNHAKRAAVSIIVNRFGDIDNQVSAHANNMLLRLLQECVGDTDIVVSEICSFLTRPNLSFKASYTAVCFLAQIMMDTSHSGLANMLFGVYLNLFNNFNFENDVKSKMMKAIMTGITRVLPYTKDVTSKNIANIDKIFKLANSYNTSPAIRALIILFHIKQEQPEITERYNVTFYNFLFRLSISDENSSIMLLFNLLKKSIASQPDKEKQRILCKQLLHVCLHSPPEFSCTSILLLSEIFTKKDQIKYLLTYLIDEDDGDENVNNVSSWYFKSINDENRTTVGIKKEKLKYGADTASLPTWEFSLLKRHYHSSVRNLVNDFLNLKAQHSGDPLVDFTYTAFIDRMINRQAKNAKCNPTPNKILAPKSKTNDNFIKTSLFPEDKLLKQHSDIKLSTTKKSKKRRRKSEEDLSDEEFEGEFQEKHFKK